MEKVKKLLIRMGLEMEQAVVAVATIIFLILALLAFASLMNLDWIDPAAGVTNLTAALRLLPTKAAFYIFIALLVAAYLSWRCWQYVDLNKDLRSANRMKEANGG